MPGATAVSAVYVTGWPAFRRLCRTAPTRPDDAFQHHLLADEPADQSDQDPTEKSHPGHHNEQHGDQDCGRSEARERAPVRMARRPGPRHAELVVLRRIHDLNPHLRDETQ
jgi:hypothetical protein